MSNHNDKELRKATSSIKLRTIICVGLTIPILFLSPLIQGALGLSELLQFPAGELILWALSTTIFFYGGWPYFSGSIKEIASLRPGSMLLTTIALSTVYLYSSMSLVNQTGMHLFWELASLVDIILIGHWLEIRTVTKIIAKESPSCFPLFNTARLFTSNRKDKIAKSSTQIVAEISASALCVITAIVALASFLVWLTKSHQNYAFAIERAVSVLLIASPHAFRLAVPLVMLASTNIAMQHGIIISEKSNTTAPGNNEILIAALSKATSRKIVENLLWAIVYNLVAILLATGIFYRQGVLVNPALSAIVMAMSTVLIALNAQQLRIKHRE